jgi:hypothetical protein
LRLRRPDRCAVCGRVLEAGAKAVEHRDQRVITCPGCDLTQPPDAGVAGASARREYDRRHARREDHARQTLGIVGVGLARMIDEPQHTTAWKRGAEGEERVGARLLKLLDGNDVRLLHDRRMPGAGSANIDHIAIGPGGITVIDTKNVSGKVRVDRVGGLFVPRHDVLLINGRDKTALVKGVERQLAAVQRALDQPEDASVELRGALCLADVNGLPLLRSLSVNGITIDGPRPVAKLARRTGPLTPEQVQALWQRLARVMPAA